MVFLVNNVLILDTDHMIVGGSGEVGSIVVGFELDGFIEGLYGFGVVFLSRIE